MTVKDIVQSLPSNYLKDLTANMNVTAFLLAIFLPKFSLCCPSSKESKETNKQSKESVCSSNNPCQNDGECIDKEVKIDAKVIYREFSPYANFITANFITAVFQNYY